MKLLAVARKSLLEQLREPKLLALVVLTPLGFMALFGLGYAAPRLPTHPLRLAGPAAEAAELAAALRAERYADGRPMFEVQETRGGPADEAALREQKITVRLVVAADPAGGPPGVTIRGDALNPRFLHAGTLLDGALARLHDRRAGR